MSASGQKWTTVNKMNKHRKKVPKVRVDNFGQKIIIKGIQI